MRNVDQDALLQKGLARRALLLLTPLLVEWAAVRRSVPAATVLRSGMGPVKAGVAAARAAATRADAVAVLGFGGATSKALRAGDVVVASEIRGPGGESVACSPHLVATALRSQGIRRVHVGPILSVDHVIYGRERRRLARSNALAVDMESAWLAAGAAGRPYSVVRVILDTPTHSFFHPLHAARGTLRAWRVLRQVAPALHVWASNLRATAQGNVARQ